MIYELGEHLKLTDPDTFLQTKRASVLLTKSNEAWDTLALAEIVYNKEIDLRKIRYCKIEMQPSCTVLSLYIPNEELYGEYRRFLLFIGKSHIVLVDDTDFLEKRILEMQQNTLPEPLDRERFAAALISMLLKQDFERLSVFERTLLAMDEVFTEERRDIAVFSNTHKRILPLRRKLLMLRGYYDELSDVCGGLKSNENGLLSPCRQCLFEALSERTDRLLYKTFYLLEYSQQVQEAYQLQIDARQNHNMQILTVISSLFFPLTLITGWYGMNFKNMPELESGYPFVAGLSLAVVILCLV